MSGSGTASAFLGAVIGHREVAERLRRLVDGNRLPNGLLLVGEEGRGKRTLALAFAAELLARAAPAGGKDRAAREALAGTHPGLIHVEPLREERFIPVRRVRRLLQACSLSVSWGDLRVVVLARLHMLNEESGNALLKFLEEPPPHTIILATARDPGSVLETIRSRLQMLTVGPLLEAEVARVLLARGLAPAEVPLLAALSRGAPGNAWRFRRDDFERSLIQPLRGLFDPGTNPFGWAEATVKLARDEGSTAAEGRNEVGPEAAVRAQRELRAAQDLEVEDERRSESGLEAARGWLRPLVEAAGVVLQELLRGREGVGPGKVRLAPMVVPEASPLRAVPAAALARRMPAVIECLENLDRNLTLNLALEDLALRLAEG